MAIARTARSRSVSQLNSEFQKAGNDYQAHLVFATRQFEPTTEDSRAVQEFLNLIPTED